MKSRLVRLRLIKDLYRQYSVYFYLFCALGLLVLGLSKNIWIDRVRIFTSEAASYVSSVLHTPIEGVKTFSESVQNFFTVYKQNEELKQQNAQLLYWMNQARLLSDENNHLKQQLNFKKSQHIDSYMGYIVSDDGGSFSRSLLIRLGKNDGIQKGVIGLHNGGVLGRITTVGNNASRLLLVTDFASRIPVIVGKEQYLAIAAGNNTEKLDLIALPEGATVQEGDFVSTSGHGSVFPFGLPVGIVSEISDNQIKISPFAHRHNTSFVTLVDFHLTGLLPDTVCECESEEQK